MVVLILYRFNERIALFLNDSHSMSLRRVCVAPMIAYTDRHFRYLCRIISKHVYLYTEMIAAPALVNGDIDKLLKFNPEERPLALQVGDNAKERLVLAAKLAEDYGYSEININVGCPSSKVKSGGFGVCLMKEPELVAECFHSMQQQVDIPVTVKTRIGVDNEDSFDFFYRFVETVANAGCKTFIVHARKAWLKGLSPKENRTIPELKYDFVQKLKTLKPHLEIIINGGIDDLDAGGQFNALDGIMVGRESYRNPYHLSQVDSLFYQSTERVKSRIEVINEYLPYMSEQIKEGVSVTLLTRHLYGLSCGISGGRRWRNFCQNLLKQNIGTRICTEIADAFPQG